jgi:hypothetical protein
MIPDVRDIAINIAADVSGSREIENLRDRLDDVKDELDELTGRTSRASEGMSGLTAALEGTSAASELTEEELEEVNDELQEMTASSTAASGSLAGLQSSIMLSQNAVDVLTNDIDELGDVMYISGNGADKLTKEVEDLEDAIDEYSIDEIVGDESRIEKMPSKLGETADEATRLNDALDDINDQESRMLGSQFTRLLQSDFGMPDEVRDLIDEVSSNDDMTLRGSDIKERTAGTAFSDTVFPALDENEALDFVERMESLDGDKMDEVFEGAVQRIAGDSDFESVERALYASFAEAESDKAAARRAARNFASGRSNQKLSTFREIFDQAGLVRNPLANTDPFGTTLDDDDPTNTRGLRANADVDIDTDDDDGRLLSTRPIPDMELTELADLVGGEQAAELRNLTFNEGISTISDVLDAEPGDIDRRTIPVGDIGDMMFGALADVPDEVTDGADMVEFASDEDDGPFASRSIQFPNVDLEVFAEHSDEMGNVAEILLESSDAYETVADVLDANTDELEQINSDFYADTNRITQSMAVIEALDDVDDDVLMDRVEQDLSQSARQLVASRRADSDLSVKGALTSLGVSDDELGGDEKLALDMQAFSRELNRLPSSLVGPSADATREDASPAGLRRRVIGTLLESDLDASYGQIRSNYLDNLEDNFPDEGMLDPFKKAIDDEDTTTTVDAMDDLFDRLERQGIEPRSLMSILQNASDSSRSDFMQDQDEAPILDGLNVSAIRSVDDLGDESEAIGAIEESIEEFMDLLDSKAGEAFLEAADDLGSDATIGDIVDNMDGAEYEQIQELLEEHGEVIGEVFDDPEAIVEASLGSAVDDEDGLMNAIRDETDVNMSVIQRSMMAEMMAELEPDILDSEGTRFGQIQSRVTGERLQADILQRMSETDSEFQQSQLRKLYRTIESGGFKTESIGETDVFRGRLTDELTDRFTFLEDEGIDAEPERIARELSQSISEQVAKSGNDENLATMLRDDRLVDQAISRGVDHSMVDSSQSGRMGDELGDALQVTMMELLGMDDQDFVTALTGADIDAESAQGIGGPILPETGDIDDVAESMRQRRDDDAPFLSRIESTVARFATGNLVPDVPPGKTEQFGRGGVRSLTSGLESLIPVLGVTSANLGAFNVSLGRTTGVVAGLTALLTPLVATLGAFATAAVTAGGALGAVTASGALGYTDMLENRFADVTDRGEAVEKMMEQLRGVAVEAIEPLRNAEVGGLGSMELFVTFANDMLRLLNDASGMFAQVAEMDEVAAGLAQVREALFTGNEGDVSMMSALTEVTERIGPGVFDMIVEIINALPGLIVGMARFGDQIGNAFGPLLRDIGPLVRILATFGVGFLRAMARVLSVITGLVTGLYNFISAIPVVGDGLDMLIGLLGMAAGAYYALTLASSVALAVQQTFVGTILGKVVYGLKLLVAWLTSASVSNMNFATASAVASASLTGLKGGLYRALVALKAYIFGTNLASVSMYGLATAIWSALAPLAPFIAGGLALAAVLGGLAFALNHVTESGIENFFKNLINWSQLADDALSMLAHTASVLTDALTFPMTMWSYVTGGPTLGERAFKGMDSADREGAVKPSRRQNGPIVRGIQIVNNGVMGRKDLDRHVRDAVRREEQRRSRFGGPKRQG